MTTDTTQVVTRSDPHSGPLLKLGGSSGGGECAGRWKQVYYANHTNRCGNRVPEEVVPDADRRPVCPLESFTRNH